MVILEGHRQLGVKSYDFSSRETLNRNIPIIIRLEGVAFDKYTKGLNQPFDTLIAKAMQETMMYLCRNILGCELGYNNIESITLLLMDYKDLDRVLLKGNKVQDMLREVSRMAVTKFNTVFRNLAIEEKQGYFDSSLNKRCLALEEVIERTAMFEARVYTVPLKRVEDYFKYTQREGYKKLISMLASKYFTPEDTKNRDTLDLVSMLQENEGFLEDYKEKKDFIYDFNFNFYNSFNTITTGSCYYKQELFRPKVEGKYDVPAVAWTVLEEIPFFDMKKGFITELVDLEL